MGLRNLCVVLTILLGISHGEMLGKFYFHGQDTHHETNAFNILHKPDSIHLAPSPGPIPSNEVASVLALSLGLSVPKDINWAGLQINNPFKLPKAALMISVNNVPDGHTLKMPSRASYPLDTNGDVGSVSDLYYIAPKYSLSNHVTGIFEGSSKVVSISGDDVISGGGHSSSPLTETSVWSELTKSWKIVTGDGEVKTSLSRNDVLKRVPDVLVSGFTYEEKDQTVRVHTNGLEFSFNLDDEVDFKLFSELVYISYQSVELATHGKSFARDGTPDLFLLSVSALKGIEKKYGASSQHMKGALILIEKFIGKTVKNFVDLYDGNIFIVGVSVASESASVQEHQKDMKHVLKVLEENKVVADTSGSEIHLLDQLEADAQRKLCEAVQNSLGQSTSSSVRFKCAQDLPIHKVHKRSLLQFQTTDGVSEEEVELNLNLGSDYNDNFPVIFNIWFWLFVVLVLTVYVVSIGMWNMDPGRDSIIYRLTQQKIKSE